jgi:hypothetical protein
MVALTRTRSSSVNWGRVLMLILPPTIGALVKTHALTPMPPQRIPMFA